MKLEERVLLLYNEDAGEFVLKYEEMAITKPIDRQSFYSGAHNLDFMEPRRRSTAENRIDEVYGIIAENLKKRDPRPTETIDMSPQANLEPETITQKLRDMIETINKRYAGMQIEDVDVVRKGDKYCVTLGIEEIAFRLYNPNQFFNGSKIRPEDLEEKAEQGLYLRDVSFENRQFTVIMSDAAITEEVIILTRNIDAVKRRK